MARASGTCRQDPGELCGRQQPGSHPCREGLSAAGVEGKKLGIAACKLPGTPLRAPEGSQISGDQANSNRFHGYKSYDHLTDAFSAS